MFSCALESISEIRLSAIKVHIRLDYSKNNERILMKFFMWVGLGSKGRTDYIMGEFRIIFYKQENPKFSET